MLLLGSLLVALFLGSLSAQYRPYQNFGSSYIPTQPANPALKDWFSEVTDESIYQRWKKPTQDGKWKVAIVAMVNIIVSIIPI